jgi:hypothetical protein
MPFNPCPLNSHKHMVDMVFLCILCKLQHRLYRRLYRKLYRKLYQRQAEEDLVVLEGVVMKLVLDF